MASNSYAVPSCRVRSSSVNAHVDGSEGGMGVGNMLRVKNAGLGGTYNWAVSAAHAL